MQNALTTPIASTTPTSSLTFVLSPSLIAVITPFVSHGNASEPVWETNASPVETYSSLRYGPRKRMRRQKVVLLRGCAALCVSRVAIFSSLDTEQEVPS